MSRLITLSRLIGNRDWPQLSRTLRTQALPRSWFSVHDIVFVRLDDVRVPPLRLDFLETREVTREDVPLLQRVKERRDGFAGAFAAGDTGFLTLANDRPAAYMWFETARVHRSAPNAYAFDLGADGAWSYGVEVHPDFRMRGALVKMWADALATLRKRGIARVYAGIPRDNRLSVQSHTRLGFRVLFDYHVVRFMGLDAYRLRAPGGGTRTGFGWFHARAGIPALPGAEG